MTSYPFGEDVTVVKRIADTSGGLDRLGMTPMVDGKMTTYPSVAVWTSDANSTGSNERLDGQDLVFIGLTVSLPADADVTATDQVIARGHRWNVYGQPNLNRHPSTGWAPGIPVLLTRAEG